MSLQDAPHSYALRAIYFQPDTFRSAADCLNAAHARGLPLDICQERRERR